jgi:replicative DNA helicase
MNKLALVEKIRKIELKLAHGHFSTLEEKFALHDELEKYSRILRDIQQKEEDSEPFISAYDLLKSPPPVIETIPTGIKAIDDNLGGIVKGAFIQLAAASGAGKTTLMVKILSSLAKHEKVVHFDFEMGQVKMHRMLSNYLKTDTQKKNYKIDFTHNTLDALVDKIMIAKEMGVEIFVIDSMMKIITDDKNRYDAERRISEKLSEITARHNKTIVLINQLSKEALKEGRGGLKGNIEQEYNSDIILLLQKRALPKEKPEDIQRFDETKRKLVCSKNRFGDVFEAIIEREEVMPEKNYEHTTAQVVEMPTI